MTSLLDTPATRANRFATIFASVAIAKSVRRVRRRSLRENLDAVTGPRGESRAGDDALARIAHAYYRAGRLISAHDRCLPLSLAIMRAAIARGYRPQLVLGVTLGPFSAHCWVQQGAKVMSDRVDRVRCYTPILIV